MPEMVLTGGGTGVCVAVDVGEGVREGVMDAVGVLVKGNAWKGVALEVGVIVGVEVGSEVASGMISGGEKSEWRKMRIRKLPIMTAFALSIAPNDENPYSFREGFVTRLAPMPGWGL
jgi:hypothetical protein